MSFEIEKLTSRTGQLVFQSISPNEFGEVPHTIGCKTPLGTVGHKQLLSDGAISNRRDIDHSNCVLFAGVGYH